MALETFSLLPTQLYVGALGQLQGLAVHNLPFCFSLVSDRYTQAKRGIAFLQRLPSASLQVGALLAILKEAPF